MATEQVTVIEGDGTSDSLTVTDDPVEDATVQAVRQAIGDETTASEQADSTVAATLLERVTALVDALTSGQADDEVRVALVTDLLSGNIDVDVANQSSGNLTVELAADSLTGNLDVDLAAQTSGALDVSGATVPTEQQTPVQVEDSTGTNIDPSRATDFPENEFNGADLTASDQVVGPVTVGRSQALVVRVHEPTGGSLDVSVEWQDSNGNTLGTQSATEINLSGVTTDHTRLFRKGAQAKVTFSNNTGATSANGFVDTHK